MTSSFHSMNMYGIGCDAGNSPRLCRARHSNPFKETKSTQAPGTVWFLIGNIIFSAIKTWPETWISILTMRVVEGIAWSRVFIVIEEVGGPRISRLPICKSIFLMCVQLFNISCVIILWVRRTVLLITISLVHRLWESRRSLTSFLPTNCQDPGLVWGSSAKFGTGYRVSETSLGK